MRKLRDRPSRPAIAGVEGVRAGKSGGATPKLRSRRRSPKQQLGPIAVKSPGSKGAVVPAARPSQAVAPTGAEVDHQGAKPSPRPLSRSGDRVPVMTGQMMELHWDDAPPPSQSRAEGLVERWMKRGDALLRHLAEHGAARHEYRADLKEGRFVWLDPEGRVSAEARAQVLCSWSPSTGVLAMAWADPLLRGAAVPRVDGTLPERDDLDAEGAWRVAMEAAEAARAEYLYRVPAPHSWYFLALRDLSFAPERDSFIPGTPVGLVLKSLGETRLAIESRAEPAEVVRARLASVGQALLHQAGYAYRGTDWVARLERTGRRLVQLADRLPRPSFKSVAAGRHAEEWLNRDATIDLSQALAMLEDEWALFA